jgi:hypothetical protein
LPGLGNGNIAFVVPAAGYTGVTRMRVREVFANSNIDPCLQYTFGEIEDFTIIISPNCPVGYKLWLGNTDDWNNPGNWCGGIPTITDDAVIDRVQVFPPIGTPSRPYFRPTIKSNILANANNLTISALDSVIINSPTPSSNPLKLRRDLINNGRIKVISSFANNVVYSNGTLVNNIYTPLKAASTDVRTQIIYSQAELTLAGLVPNDNITGIQFSLNFKGSTAAFGGFTVSYAQVPFTQHASNVPYAGPFTTVFGPSALTTIFPGVNTINLVTPIVWDGVNNILIQYCFDNASNVGSNDDRINITQTTGIKSTLILSSTTNAAAGCALVPGVGVTDNFFSGLASFRPNFTFLVNRPYGKALITVQEDWLNNGFFDAGYSRVRMDSTVAQTIAGTQPTTFNELEVNKGAASQFVTMMRAITVDSSVALLQGQLRMNTYSLTMNNPSAMGATGNLVSPKGPFERTNGFLISESSTASVIWNNINSVFGYRVVPFGSGAVAAPLYIPFSFLHKSGDMGNLDISTFNSPGNATLPPTVTHINNTAGAGNAAGTVDRFWILSKTGVNPVTDIMYRFTTLERATGMSAFNQGKAQPWWNLNQNRAWIRLITPYTSATYTQSYGVNASPAYDSVRVTNWDWPTLPAQLAGPFYAQSGPIGNSNPWAITANTTPLPVELVNFDAKLVDTRVKLSWTTASEINNDFFTVERADKDLTKFDFIAKVNSYMHNSNVMLNYETWDESPMQGLQYYRLKQTDMDGEFTYSDLRPIFVGAVKSFEITNVYGNSLNNGQFQIEFVYDSELPLSAIITDATGRVIFNQGGIPAVPGINKIQLDQSLSQGIYFIILQNQEKKVSQKFFY